LSVKISESGSNSEVKDYIAQTLWRVFHILNLTSLIFTLSCRIKIPFNLSKII